MDTKKMAHGGLAALSLIGLLVSSNPGEAQVMFNALPSLAAQTPVTFNVLSSIAAQDLAKFDINSLLWNGPSYNEVRVNSPAELETVLRSDFVGHVVVPRGKYFNMTGRAFIPIHSGVQLIGERGELGSRPSLYTDSKSIDSEGYSFFVIEGNDIVVQGLHFRGPSHSDRDRSGTQPYVSAIYVLEDADNQQGRRILIADNEFNEWTKSGVQLEGTHSVRTPDQYDRHWARLGPQDAGLVRVERNYFHHNATDGAGHGVGVSGGAYVTVFGNVFDFNRHAVEAEGRAYSGYVARFNYVLQGGYTQAGSYNQHFDMHGTNDTNGDNKSTGYGGSAGEYVEIAFNTIRGAQGYFVVKTRPAFMLRGRPTIGAYFHDNACVHEDLDAAVSLKWEKGDSGIGEDEDQFNFHDSGNAFETDHSSELATGDFDGDGHTDVFVAAGTAWFFSRGGSEPWEFLHASTKLTRDLAFADIDNDGRTDVLYRDPAGNLGYLKSGVVDLVPLTTTPVAIKDLRFGDFDGDGKTDIFYTLGGQWWIWYGRTRAWTPAQTSSLSISELLFGEFDNVRGTDVAGVTSGMWAYSSAALGSWTKLNNKLMSSFKDAVVGDFDGNGKSDIAFTDSTHPEMWYYSADGRSVLRDLRAGDGLVAYPPLKSLLIGHFEGGARAQVLGFYQTHQSSDSALRDRFAIWKGLGSPVQIGVYSWQNMR